MDSKFNKWYRWFDRVYLDVTNLSRYRAIFWEVQDIIRKNQQIHKPSSFYEFLGQSYVAYAVMGIRRQLKFHPDSISFARLLDEIVETPQVLSRHRFVQHYKGTAIEHLADSDFDRFAGDAKDHVDPQLVHADLRLLLEKGKSLEDYADKRIAHIDKRKPRTVPTFDQVDECVDFIEDLTKKYFLLIRCEALLSVLPTHLNDWKSIFYEPWILMGHED